MKMNIKYDVIECAGLDDVAPKDREQYLAALYGISALGLRRLIGASISAFAFLATYLFLRGSSWQLSDFVGAVIFSAGAYIFIINIVLRPLVTHSVKKRRGKARQNRSLDGE